MLKLRIKSISLLLPVPWPPSDLSSWRSLPLCIYLDSVSPGRPAPIPWAVPKWKSYGFASVSVSPSALLRGQDTPCMATPLENIVTSWRTCVHTELGDFHILSTIHTVSYSNTGQKHKHSLQSLVRVFNIGIERCGRQRTAYSSYSRNKRFSSVSEDRLSVWGLWGFLQSYRRILGWYLILKAPFLDIISISIFTNYSTMTLCR